MAGYKVALIKGDGVGPEVIGVALSVLDAVGFDAEYVEVEAGEEYFRKSGSPIEPDALEKLKSCDAALKGPLTTPVGGGYRSVNVYLRRELGLYANVRPFKAFKGVSLRDDFDIVIIRENTEGLYTGAEVELSKAAISFRVVTREGSERLCEFAFRYAMREGRKRVTVVHKANILKASDGLFRDVFFEVAERYPELEADEVIVDAAAYRLVKNPSSFEVLVTPNLYGDILSDLAAGLVGSIGLCGSGQYGDEVAIFEPVHGTAPDIAGKGVANPVGAVAAAAMMLDWLSVTRGDESLSRLARKIRKAIEKVVEERLAPTPDLGGAATTRAVERAICKVVSCCA